MAEDNGLLMVHAASLACDSSGVLIVGEGGAGKSGTVLAGLMHGLSSAGDDYTLINAAGAQAAYCTVKQNRSGLERLQLRVNTAPNWQGKFVFRPEEVIGQPIARQAPFQALLVPKIGASRSHMLPIDPGDVFRMLVFSTLRQLGSGYEQVFRECGAIVRQLPCYQFNVSESPVDIADSLKRFFETQAC